MLLGFLNNQDIDKKKFLELGCGSGIISVMAAKKGSIVTASDINTKAIENVILNAKKNQVKISAIHSDLFNQLPKKAWDWIIINPPYYPANPVNEAEHAWYCGQEHQYFEAVFQNLHQRFYGCLQTEGSTDGCQELRGDLPDSRTGNEK